ncbi:MAG: phosphoserine phosphatase SerB [Thaumarchaeota archaeon]|nr:phosphoserine phosphatase SerB [Nitrososphaerota archaeon]MCL5317977.1 phosphoserine phosphatase SerB [Nitrososphaerota archaeon]
MPNAFNDGGNPPFPGFSSKGSGENRPMIIFDIEGVLIDGEFFPELAKLLGVEEEVTEITLKGIRGEIEWKQGLMQRIEKVKGTPYETCLKVCDSLPYTPGAKEICRHLKQQGWIIVAVSGGPTLLSNRVAKELNVDYVYANDLIFKEDRLETMDVYVDADKSAPVKSLVQEMGLKKEHIVTVIDGANDLKLLGIAGTSIAFNASRIIEERATHKIKVKDLRQVLPLIENLPKPIIRVRED